MGRARYFLRMLALIVGGYGVTALVTIDPFHIAGRAPFSKPGQNAAVAP